MLFRNVKNLYPEAGIPLLDTGFLLRKYLSLLA